MYIKVYFIKHELTNLQIIPQNTRSWNKNYCIIYVLIWQCQEFWDVGTTHKLFVYMRNSEEVVWVNGGFVEENGMKIARLKTLLTLVWSDVCF